MRNVTFLGAGSWGTALAILCANNGHKVTIWSAVESELEMLRVNREHKDRLPGVILPDSIEIEGDIEKACENRDILVFSVASPFVRATAERIKPFVKKGQMIVNVAKGIEDGTLMTLCEIIEDVLPDADVAVLSGPSHAEEVSKGVPTTVVVGAHSEKTARRPERPGRRPRSGFPPRLPGWDRRDGPAAPGAHPPADRRPGGSSAPAPGKSPAQGAAPPRPLRTPAPNRGSWAGADPWNTDR